MPAKQPTILELLPAQFGSDMCRYGDYREMQNMCLPGAGEISSVPHRPGQHDEIPRSSECHDFGTAR